MPGRASRSVSAAAVALAAMCALVAFGCASRPSTIENLPAPVVSGAVRATDPALVATPDGGDLVLAWLAGDSTKWRLYSARSSDRGSTWSEPVAITPPGEHIHPHGEASPRLLVASGGRVAAVWSTSLEVPGRQWPASTVRMARSSDGGRSWNAPVTLNDDSLAAPAGHTFQGATVVGDSAIVVAWLDERPAHAGAASESESMDDASLYCVRSDDFGATWGRNRPMTGRVCPCCRVNLAAGGTDAMVAWRKHYPGQVRDIVVASLDGAPVRTFDDQWKIEGCPHTGPAIALTPKGERHLAWFSGAPGRTGVFYRRWSSGPPDSAAAPLTIQIGDQLPTAHVSLAAATGGQAVVAWDLGPDGKRAVTLARTDDTGRRVQQSFAIGNSEGATYPQVVLLEGGNEALVVWTNPAGGETQRLGVARVQLGGPTAR